MDSKVREGDTLVDDNSAKKKFKFKSFKKFFGLKKRKETLPSLGSIRLKQSQSASDVTAPDSGKGDYDSEDDIEAAAGVLGSRAVSHDSIFIPEVVQESTRPVRVFSQENVSDNIKALQKKLQSNIKIGPPPLGLLSKRTEDGTSSEDDGLPRSPPEMSLIHDSIKTRFSDIHRHHSSLSLGGTGSEEDEQISSETYSRPLSPEDNTLKDAHESSIERRDSAIFSPSADFATPPQFSSFLDNSAARHRLSVKPRNQRSSKIRRPSAALQEESFAGLNCMQEEDVTEPNSESLESPPTEDLTPYKDHNDSNSSPSANSSLLNVEEDKEVAAKVTVGSESQTNPEQVKEPIAELRLQPEMILSARTVTMGEKMKVSDELLGGSDLKAKEISSKLHAVVKRASSISPSSRKPSIKFVRAPGDNNEKPANTHDIPGTVKTTPSSHSEESVQSRRSFFRHSLLERNIITAEQLLSDKENNNKLGSLDKKTERSPTEAGTQRKFSVSSAWERPRTNSFNLRANTEGDGAKNTTLTSTKLGVSETENKEEDKTPATIQTESRLTGRKKEPLGDSEAAPSDKPVSDNITSLQNPVPAPSDSSMSTDVQAVTEDKNPFFKLRPTSLSLRYREGMNPVTTTVKRHSGEFKQEKPGSLSKEEIHKAGQLDLTVSSKIDIKEDGTTAAQTKPPLPKKPVLQNITVADNNTNKDMTENEPSQEVKSERKMSERRLSVQKLLDKCTPAVVPAEPGKGSENKVHQPSWMTTARQKQLSFKDEHPIYKQRTASQEADKQNKERTEVHLKQQPADQIQNKTINASVQVVPEKTKTETNEPRQRANTLPYPVPGTPLSLLKEKEEKVIPKRPTLSVSEEPNWMEMAKKKSQAWSDMPHSIKQ